MENIKGPLLERLYRDAGFKDRGVYRKNISTAGKYSYRLAYRYSDIYITSDKEISQNIKKTLINFYGQLEKVIAENREFRDSLSPVDTDENWPPAVKGMCRSAAIFGVGPMAAVAGAVCDCIAGELSGGCSFLMIENGGDVYIKSTNKVNASLFSCSRHFPETIDIIISPGSTPCGLCSSSGMMGHSLSLGKSDLVTVMSENTAAADAAATAVANEVATRSQVDTVMEKYAHHSGIKGLIIIKDDRLALWGGLQLAG